LPWQPPPVCAGNHLVQCRVLNFSNAKTETKMCFFEIWSDIEKLDSEVLQIENKDCTKDHIPLGLTPRKRLQHQRLEVRQAHVWPKQMFIDPI
jgi:hypothetical protein